MEWPRGPNGPASPKKKSSFRTKLGTTSESVRESFKNAKDISARNLMEKMNGEDEESCSSESVIEEVVDLEDETSEMDEEEYIEEIIDDSDTDSILEPLPPPIDIPAELQVKDESEKSSTNESDDDDNENEEEQEDEPPLSTSVRPGGLRGHSFFTKEEIADRQRKVQEKSFEATIEENDEDEEKSERDVSTLSPKVSPYNSPNAQDRPTVQWKKPDWANGANLRATGKSPAGNLAKPITPTRDLAKLTLDVSSPEAKQCLHSTQSPKSAPTTAKEAVVGPPVAGDRDDDTLGKIEWKKPEWTRKKILRDTSKGQKLMAGQDISRPIGGIRAVSDSK